MVVYIAPNLKEAERLKIILLHEGFMVQLNKLGLKPCGSGPVEVLVPECEVDEAIEVLQSR